MIGFIEAAKIFMLICCLCLVFLILLISCDILRYIFARIKQKLRERKLKEVKYIIWHLREKK